MPPLAIGAVIGAAVLAFTGSKRARKGRALKGALVGAGVTMLAPKIGLRLPWAAPALPQGPARR